MITTIYAALVFILPSLTKAASEDLIKLQLLSIKIGSKVGHENISSIDAGVICIGTPCQKFTVMLDSGSSDLWVSSTRCTSDICQKQHRFDEKKSSTYRNSDATFSIQYGTGQMKGVFGTDDVNVAGIKVKQQKFGQATTSSPEFANAGLDGILGLGLKGVARGGTTPLFYNMVNQSAVKNPVFTFCKSQDTVLHPVNELILGDTDRSRYPGKEMVFVPIQGDHYWKFQMDKILVGNDDSACADGCFAVPDSGTTMIRGPRPLIEAINQKIGTKPYKETQFEVNCDPSDLPEVHFVIGGRTFSISPYDYVIPVSNKLCVTGFAVTQSRTATFMILGSVFMNGHCTQFDLGQRRVGFVALDEE